MDFAGDAGALLLPHVLEMRVQRPQLFVGISQLFLRALAFAPFLGFAQRPLHRRHQAGEMGLQHVIGSALFQHLDHDLLAKYAGDKDERHVRSFSFRNLQGHAPVETRQRIVGQDEIGRPVAEFRLEGLTGFHDHDGDLESGLVQHMLDQLNIRHAILDEQNAQFTREPEQPARRPGGRLPMTVHHGRIQYAVGGIHNDFGHMFHRARQTVSADGGRRFVHGQPEVAQSSHKMGKSLKIHRFNHMGARAQLVAFPQFLRIERAREHHHRE